MTTTTRTVQMIDAICSPIVRASNSRDMQSAHRPFDERSTLLRDQSRTAQAPCSPFAELVPRKRNAEFNRIGGISLRLPFYSPRNQNGRRDAIALIVHHTGLDSGFAGTRRRE